MYCFSKNKTGYVNLNSVCTDESDYIFISYMRFNPLNSVNSSIKLLNHSKEVWKTKEGTKLGLKTTVFLLFLPSRGADGNYTLHVKDHLKMKCLHLHPYTASSLLHPHIFSTSIHCLLIRIRNRIRPGVIWTEDHYQHSSYTNIVAVWHYVLRMYQAQQPCKP